MRKPSPKPLRVCARALVLLVLVHVALAEARVEPADIGRQTLRLFTDEDGVPQNAVTAVVLDREGYRRHPARPASRYRTHLDALERATGADGG